MFVGGRLSIVCVCLSACQLVSCEVEQLAAQADLPDDETTLLQFHTAKKLRSGQDLDEAGEEVPDPNAHLMHMLYGRLRDPNQVLCDDPRVHPLPLNDYMHYLADNDLTCDPKYETNTGPKVTPDSPTLEIMTFMEKHERLQRAMFDKLMGVSDDLPEGRQVSGVSYEEIHFTGPDSSDITIYRSWPTEATGLLPGVLHFHGGGMASLSAGDKVHKWWRRRLAFEGLVVLGVEFRNSAGALGPFPFPKGLDDCMAALAYVSEQKEQLKINKLILVGEDGGGNLALATALRAKMENNIAQIDGVYVQAPFIADPGTRSSKGRFMNLFSIRENDNYVITKNLVLLNSKVYDPDGSHRSNPLCWPIKASFSELEGLPPHIISVNEVDPLRDEGLEYGRKLAEAGVNTYSKILGGTWHGSDTWPTQSDTYKADSSAREIGSFAKSL